MKEVILSHPPKGPVIFKRMIKDVDKSIKKGDIVKVINKNGEFFGYAFYNPESVISFRLITRENIENFDIINHLENRIKNAYELRRRFSLPNELTNAYRLIHDWGDGVNGITIDIFNDICVVELYSYGYYLFSEKLKEILKKVVGVSEVFFVASSYAQTMEGFKVKTGNKKKVKIKENGIIFEIIIGEGYKTGFFCDQRENRFYLTNFVNDKTVCDLFSYTGGFGLYAKKYGAKEVECVELDEWAYEQIKRNANLNNLKLKTIRSDAFNYMRQMIENKKLYDVVILDPNKLITSREERENGIAKYVDLNKLALRLVKPGGIFVSCSCSGMLSMDEFIQILKKASSISKRLVRVFKKTGAGVDHPFSINYPEGEYLKVVWMVVE